MTWQPQARKDSNQPGMMLDCGDRASKAGILQVVRKGLGQNSLKSLPGWRDGRISMRDQAQVVSFFIFYWHDLADLTWSKTLVSPCVP